ncbi:MAG: choice-of-anchor I family protein [Lachnospiraceae bacterium]|nr:choice-of-anchor I family protein [Lachnospiraceae bacterium]
MKKWSRKVSRVLAGVLVAGMVFNGCLAGESVKTFAAQAAKEEGFENGLVLDMKKVSSYVSGCSNMDGGVAEIISYDTENQTAWVVNGATGKLDILKLADGTEILDDMQAVSLDIRAMLEQYTEDFVYGDMTSVAVNPDKGIVAVAVQAEAYDQNGLVAVLSTEGSLITVFEAGCQPDMVTFTPDGSRLLAANEGEPREGFGEGVTDPAGSVTVITLNEENVAESDVVTVGFGALDEKAEELREAGILMVKDNSPSLDFEPEYIAATDTKAYIALQENNAIAVLNLATKEFDGVYSLGYKDLGREENALDLVEDGVYQAETYKGAVSAYMSDGIAVYTLDGVAYLLTANEGDAREWGSEAAEYCNEIKETLVSDNGTEAKKVRVIDPTVTDGMPEGKTVLYGGRSFSVYRVEENGLVQVFDSGNDFERLTAAYFPEYFNCSNDDNEYDSRSPKKGPEPESVVTGTVDGKIYAFAALERMGGIMVYDITNPEEITYCSYINTRDFSENPAEIDLEAATKHYLTGDIAPEGLCFISAENSPNGTAILLAAFEVSGTVAVYSVESVEEEVIYLGTSREDAGKNKGMEPGTSLDVNYYGVKNWTREAYEAVWISSDETVAVVDNMGLVTAREEGETCITLVLRHKITGKMFAVKPMKITVKENDN